MNVYRLIILSVFLTGFMFSCQTKEAELIPNTFTIQGEIKGLGNNNLYFRYPNKVYEKKGYWRDSILVTNDKFTFTDSISDYQFITFSTSLKALLKQGKRGGYYPVKSAYLNTMLYPGANITVSGKVSDFMDAYPHDNSVNNDFAELHKDVFPKMNESVNLLLASNSEKEQLKSEALKHIADSIGEVVLQIKKDYIMSHSKSLASIYYLADMMMRTQISDEDAILAFKNLDTTFSNTVYYKETSERIVAINETKEGSVAPRIVTTSTLDNKEFDLASYKGKYVMIDFWGIWCGPCVSEMPQVKAFRAKYKDKLEVLGINSGDKKQAIIDFVTKHDYSWQQIMDNSKSDTDNFVLKYNVAGFPTKIIIDPEGNIVKRFVGSGEEAFELLEELLN